ncbi:MAG: hypothetical protein NT077_03050 [Candidatus Taylorbacteria bacterium]|nr:hypothetical protein [Candidatus Taylorbacteria bacterium]
MRTIYKTSLGVILDALFPLSKAEEELLQLSVEEAFSKLPPAPAYDRSVVPLPATRSIFAYKDERVSKLVWSIKYKKSAHSIQIGGYALFQTLKKLTKNDSSTSPAKTTSSQNFEIILVPIPITSRRRRERGFNQCELLLDEVRRLDVENKFTHEKNLICRVQHTSRQTLKGRDERLESSKGIFSVNEKVAQQIRQIKQKSQQINIKDDQTCRPSSEQLIVVLDDVITTGSTMKEALDVLKSAGFSNVAGLSLAH